MIARSRKRSLATIAVLSCSIGWAHGCGIDLSDQLAGRPCKNGACLPGYVCSDANICMLDPGTGGGAGTGGSSGEGGTLGASGGAEASGGTDPDGDATSDVPVVPDAADDRSGDAAGGSAGSGGSADSGGADSGGSAGADSGSNPWPGVGCQTLTCGPAETCCIAPFPGFTAMPPPATAFSCVPPGATCDFTLHCDGDHDCPNDEQCCVAQTAGGWVASCAATCLPPRWRVGCTRPEHCSPTLLCCGDWSFQVNRFSSVLCSTSCNGLSDRVLCNSDDDCVTPVGCRDSAAMPGFKTCQ